MNVLITGGSRGIGLELVKKFLNSNAKIVVFTGHPEELTDIFGDKIQAVKLNFLDNDIDNQIAKVFKTLNIKFDIVINNAGLLINQKFTESTIENAFAMYRVNYLAPMLICKQIIDQYAKDNCHIVNIGSMGGVQGSVKFPGLALYSGTKAALANLTECLAEEFKESSIKINCLALGSAQTEMLAQAFPDYKAPVTAEEMASYIFDFSIQGGNLFNGKIIPVAVTTP